MHFVLVFTIHIGGRASRKKPEIETKPTQHRSPNSTDTRVRKNIHKRLLGEVFGHLRGICGYCIDSKSSSATHPDLEMPLRNNSVIKAELLFLRRDLKMAASLMKARKYLEFLVHLA